MRRFGFMLPVSFHVFLVYFNRYILIFGTGMCFLSSPKRLTKSYSELSEGLFVYVKQLVCAVLRWVFLYSKL